jgi:phage shock protein E
LDTIEKNIILTEPDKNKEIYLYCRSGNRSGKATRILQNLGYRNVTNIGGIQSASINLNIPIVTK